MAIYFWLISKPLRLDEFSYWIGGEKPGTNIQQEAKPSIKISDPRSVVLQGMLPWPVQLQQLKQKSPIQ